MRLQGVFGLPHRKKCTLKNCADLWDSMKGRPKHHVKGKPLEYAGRALLGGTRTEIHDRKVWFQVLKALTDGANWFLLLLESPADGSKSNSTSYGRAYTGSIISQRKAGNEDITILSCRNNKKCCS